MRNVCALLLAILAGTACSGAPQPFTVAVWDYAGLPDTVIGPAVAFAKQGFQAAGMNAIWTICRLPDNADPDCTAPLPSDGRYVNMLVMPKMPTALSGGSAHDVAGFALVGSYAFAQRRAWAFYDVVQGLAEKSGHPPQTVLGYVLVHEIAHIMGVHHGDCGVMRATLSVLEMADPSPSPLFTPMEAKQISVAAARLTQLIGGKTYVAAARK